MKNFKNAEQRFNNEYKETLYKSKKTNFGLFSSLVLLAIKSKGLNPKPLSDMNISKKYLKTFLVNNNNSFKSFGSKDINEHAILAANSIKL